MASVKMIKLASGSMPQLGLGTWRSDTGLVKKAVEVAIATGYRHIDAAWIYGNEREVGDGLSTAMAAHNLKREDVFVTSKLWSMLSFYPFQFTPVPVSFFSLVDGSSVERGRKKEEGIRKGIRSRIRG